MRRLARLARGIEQPMEQIPALKIPELGALPNWSSFASVRALTGQPLSGQSAVTLTAHVCRSIARSIHIPEPVAIGLLGLGLSGLAVARRWRWAAPVGGEASR